MSEIILSGPVPGIYFPDLNFLESRPGWTFYSSTSNPNEISGMIYVCPCGCGRHGSLAFNPLRGDDLKYKRSAWNWNGSKEKPTLTPSIHHVGHWHGFLKEGIFTQA